MNVRPLAHRAPFPLSTAGADPLAAALRSGSPLDRPDEEASTNEAQARADTSLEDDIAAKAKEAAAERQTKEFELNVRRADIVNSVSRARSHDGRKLCTPHDAAVMWQMEALLHSITGRKDIGADATFDDPDTSRPINSAVDRAIRGLDAPPNAETLRALALLSRSVSELRDAHLQAVGATKIVPADHDPDA